MKKINLLTFVLTLIMVMSMCTCGVVFAAETADTANQQQGNYFVENLSMIVTYCIFILALIIGIPILKKMNKRDKIQSSENIIISAKREAERVKALAEKSKGKYSSQEVLRTSLYLNVLAERILSVYSNEQIDGYLDVYNMILQAKSKLTSCDKKNNTEVIKNINSAYDTIQTAVKKLEFVTERENKIIKYNG